MYPFWCGCVPLPLSSAASWLLSSLLLCGRCRCVCFVLASPPFVMCFPHDGRVLFGGCCVIWFTCCLDTEVTLYIIALSFHLHCIGLISNYCEFVRGGADSCHRPLRFASFMSFCGFWLFDSCGFFVGCLGRALLALFCFCDFFGRAVDPR